MHPMLFRSLWTTRGDLHAALRDCSSGLFDGVEGPVPLDARQRHEFANTLREARVPFIAEIATGGGYVPHPSASPEEHLEEFRRKAEAAMECAPLRITALAGADAWLPTKSVDFFGRAMALAASLGVPVSFETHRSRPTFNPWNTCEILTQLPELRLTCDFSHWCCVCERLVLDSEPAILGLCAERADHIHARVGYDQGAQVPHPAAPEYRVPLEAHERWWRAIWTAQQESGRSLTTMTPEFGPDGYLHTLPFTAAPVADLDEVNRWMATRVRQTFAQFAGTSGCQVTC